MQESDLYVILEKYYLKLGYQVKGEVCGCDLIAIKEEEMLIIEIKKIFNVKLLYQAVRRLAATPVVYVAIGKPSAKQKMSWYTMMKSLCRRLHLGLILIEENSVRILTQPAVFSSRISLKLKNKILKEFHGRRVGSNLGGITGKKLETAYLENAIHISVLLKKHKFLTPKKLREYGSSENTYSILYHNHYGWYEKIQKGTYGLKKGQAASIKKTHPEIWHYYQNLNQGG